jgi:DNA helicase-2/ATP-dependent DNA helicase PcrA
MMDLSSLNEKQREAVTAPLGPVLVLAGAGSGKTRALAYRIAYLCNEGLVNPYNILALTFTNKAAKEMGERVRKIMNWQAVSSKQQTLSNSQLPHMGTFHSICAKLLRQEIHRLGYTRGFTIYDSDDQGKVVKEIIGDLNVDKRYNPNYFRGFISSAKNILQTPAELNIGLEPDMQNLVREVYSRYQNYLFHQNAVDFDDLLMLTVKIFQNFPEVLKKYQQLFSYILVDEYQDTNHAQYVFLYLLAQITHNLFVVGDDAQSIYGFRGSSIRNILSFEQDFPETKVVKLEQNYRSTKNILDVAQKVIELNPEQKKKTLWTENEAGKKIQIVEQEDESEEAQFVAKTIIKMVSPAAQGGVDELEYEPEEKPFSILDHFLKKAKKSSRMTIGFSSLPQLPKDHGSLNDFAILFRTHSQSRALEEVLIESAVPYQIIGGLKFYERKEIKDILAYLRLAINYRDLISLKRVINEPARGIGERSYQLLRDIITKESIAAAGKNSDVARDLAEFRAKIKEIKFGPKIGKAVDEFFHLIEQFSLLEPEESLSSLMRLIIKRTQYEAWLRDGTDMGETRWENVEELFNVTEKFQGMPWREGLEIFLEEVALIMEIDESQETKDVVTLMTLHSAKGLEFDTVFLVGLEEGILPHSRSLLNPSELSEEVRLAYVGLTRARKNLFLTFARRRRAFGNVQYNQPSRILRALPKDQVEYKGSPLGSFGETTEYVPFDDGGGDY